MAGQEELKDYQGNAPELGFYDYAGCGRNNPSLIFKDQEGSWKVRHYIIETIEMVLTKDYFKQCEKVSDGKVRDLILEYRARLKHLEDNTDIKKRKEKSSKLEKTALSSA